MWKKIHPSEKGSDNIVHIEEFQKKEKKVLTVWKRSSISFQGTDGFTVFDPINGKMVFRVDNYSRKNPHLLLMDGHGNALLTFKPQMMSLRQQWNAYTNELDGKVFSMRNSSVFNINGTAGAEIFMGSENLAAARKGPDFKIEGSFKARDCKIKASNGEVVAIMARKRVNNKTSTTLLLTDDVFSLVIQPGFDSRLIMAFIVVLDRISNHPFSPFLCS